MRNVILQIVPNYINSEPYTCIQAVLGAIPCCKDLELNKWNLDCQMYSAMHQGL